MNGNVHVRRTSGYYAAIVSGKKELLSMEHKYSGVVCELTPSIMPYITGRIYKLPHYYTYASMKALFLATQNGRAVSGCSIHYA